MISTPSTATPIVGCTPQGCQRFHLKQQLLITDRLVFRSTVQLRKKAFFVDTQKKRKKRVCCYYMQLAPLLISTKRGVRPGTMDLIDPSEQNNIEPVRGVAGTVVQSTRQKILEFKQKVLWRLCTDLLDPPLPPVERLRLPADMSGATSDCKMTQLVIVNIPTYTRL